jgi:P2 family phage contractile tail tube protein
MFAKKVKDVRLYNEANNYQGLIAEMTIPKIVAITQDWRAGGMVGPVKTFHGVETPELEFTLGGHDDLIVTQAGLAQLDGTLIRAMAAIQDDQTGGTSTVEAVMRGRQSELDFGTWKPGEDTEEKVKMTCSYYKLISNGTEIVEIDMIAGIYMIGGVDRWADIRAALGG